MNSPLEGFFYAIVTGNDNPLSTNSELLLVAEETVTVAPLALSVPVWLLLLPTLTLPKAIVVGATVNVPPAVPVPERGKARLGLGAFDVSVSVPVTFPAALGENNTLKV